MASRERQKKIVEKKYSWPTKRKRNFPWKKEGLLGTTITISMAGPSMGEGGTIRDNNNNLYGRTKYGRRRDY